MEKKDFALGKLNYIICAASFALIIIGFLLMTGSSSSIEGGFQPDIFSARRIVAGPMVSFFGFLLMIAGILYPTTKQADNSSAQDSPKA